VSRNFWITAAALCMLLAACKPAPDPAEPMPITVTVFAASSLTDAFKEMAAPFRVAHPGVNVVFNFGSSSTLATQLKDGAPADVFASANAKQMDVAKQSGRIGGQVATFVTNRLILAVPAANPAKIDSLKDLAKPGIKLVLAAPSVPVRDYTNQMLDALAKSSDYGEAYRTAFMKNVVSEEDNVRQVAAKLVLGEADAAIIYQSDITPDNKSKITAITIPDEFNSIASYPIAVTNNSANAAMAQAFVDYVMSDAGQATLAKWNFIPVHANAVSTSSATAATTP
jgi:molybdate transport system substrate-binding protein